MKTIEYWGEDLTFDENVISPDELKSVIEQIYIARDKAAQEIPNIENNLVSATALMLIGTMYDAAQYDTSDIPNPDAPLNVTLNIFNIAYKMRLSAKHEELFRKVTKEYNNTAKQLANVYNVSQERIEQLSILFVAKQYINNMKNE